jgi:hypothetical protein
LEKFDFCTVISIKVAPAVVCVPAAAGVPAVAVFAGVSVVAAAGVGGGVAAFFLWKAPNAELPSADPKTPSLLASPAAVCAAVSVATWPATELPEEGGAAAGAGCAGVVAVF